MMMMIKPIHQTITPMIQIVKNKKNAGRPYSLQTTKQLYFILFPGCVQKTLVKKKKKKVPGNLKYTNEPKETSVFRHSSSWS